MELASRFNIYAYDAYMIACAINENCPLLSLDTVLIGAAKSAGINVLEKGQENADLS